MYICNIIALTKVLKMKYTTQKIYDFIGISSASLCLLHCLLVPIVSLLPISFFDSVWIDILFCCIAMLATSKIIINKSTKSVKLILGLSITIVLISVVIEIIFHTHFEGMLIGGIGLIIGHFLNYKSHQNS
jgi:hypothetical protein